MVVDTNLPLTRRTMADRLDDLYIKLTTGTLQELLGWVTLCSNRVATQTNNGEHVR
jgi:hypothetical protein